ncbi:hypothetical protein ACFPRL_23825 [Pseudoclavibacter helvolus]
MELVLDVPGWQVRGEAKVLDTEDVERTRAVDGPGSRSRDPVEEGCCDGVRVVGEIWAARAERQFHIEGGRGQCFSCHGVGAVAIDRSRFTHVPVGVDFRPSRPRTAACRSPSSW